MRVAAIVTLVLVGLAAVEACGRRRRHRPRPPGDTTKPAIHCPTVPPQKADKFQDNAVVTWEEPVYARDNQDGFLAACRTGKAPGSLFSGDTTLSYKAQDRSGNYNSCSFTISVTVTTCPEWGPTTDGWKKCHTSDKMRRGSVCRFGCYQGHYLDPPNSDRAECQDNGQWSIPDQPVCSKVTCPTLTPETSQVTIDCSDANNYRSICTYSCATGYDVLPGFSKVRVCSSYGEWLGIVPQCVDFDNCLSSPCRNDGNCSDAIDSFHCACALGYTGSMCQVNIDDCTAAPCDNGAPCVDGVASFTCACPYGYTGTLCETQVVDGSWFDWEQWSECSVTCGRGHRSRVRVCDEPLNGGMECEGANHDGKECVDSEEECINECADDPTPIEHGALDCIWIDSTNETRRCSPSCDVGYDFDSDRFLDGITCGLETGYTWNIKTPNNHGNQLPQCTEKRMAKTITMNYTGTYTDLVGNMGTDVDPNVRDKITSVVNGMVSAIGNIQTGKCRHTRTTVVNGGDEDENDARRRRAVDFVGFSVDITCVPTVIDECYDLLAAVATAMQEFVANSQLPVQIGNTIYNVDANSTYVDGIAECVQGNIPVEHYCIPCGTGSYQQGLFCQRCRAGTYQDRPEQTSCRECPEGWTTEDRQSTDVSMCNVEEPVFVMEPIADINILVVLLPVAGCLLFVAVFITLMGCMSKYSRIEEMRSTVDTTSRMNAMGLSNQRFRSAHMFAARLDSRVHPTRFDHSDVFGINVMSYTTMETEFGQTPGSVLINISETVLMSQTRNHEVSLVEPELCSGSANQTA